MDSIRPLRTIKHLPVFRGPEHPCPYLPGRTAAQAFLLDARIHAATYQSLMDAGFRRSGGVFYRPQCEGCRECVPIRVPAGQFCPSRSQQRVLRRNADVSVEIARPSPSDEKWEMYRRYQQTKHNGAMIDDRDGFEEFLYYSPIETVEFNYRIDGRLAGAGLVDACPACLSSVYFYYDPAFSRRSLGVFSALHEIGECRRRGLPYWYAGFLIRDCRRMSYKAQYRPHELLGPDGVWHTEA